MQKGKQTESGVKMIKEKKNIIIISVLAFLLAAVLAGGTIFYLNQEAPKTAVIEKAPYRLHDMSDGQLRIKIGSNIRVSSHTMQNLDFTNLNSGRLMKCFIRTSDSNEGDYIYESQFLGEGETITADVIDDDRLKTGVNKALAEIYSYDRDKNEMGQTNVEIVLEKE